MALAPVATSRFIPKWKGPKWYNQKVNIQWYHSLDHSKIWVYLHLNFQT